MSTQTNPMWTFRFLEIAIPGTFGALGVFALVAGGKGMGFGIGLLIFAAFAVLMFELRIRGHRRNSARVSAGLEQVGARDLDSPSSVMHRGSDDLTEELASNPRFARMMAGRATRMFVSGKWRGRPVEIGTAVVASRDFDQLVSYACALDDRALGPFRVMTRGAITTFARLGMPTSPVPTGDAAFDADWVADGDSALVSRVLDDSLRARLVELRAQLGFFQVASIEATRFGVIVRWPGEISADSAAYLRDLAFEVHDRLAR